MEIPTPRQDVTQRLVVAGGLVVAAAWLFGPILAGAVLAERDLVTLHWPNRAVLLRVAAEEGRLPAWNPYQACGLPLAANPHHAVWHPLTWLFFVVPFGLACNLQVLAPLAATAVGMRFLLRQRGVSRPAANYGAAVWGLGGVALSLSNLLPMLLSLAPLPWAVACAQRAGRAPGARPLLGLAASVALACAGGEPVSLLILGTAVLAASWDSERPAGCADGRGAPRLRHLGRVILGAALGAGLAAVVLVPAAELFARSARGGEAALPEGLGWSLVPARLLEILVPPASGALGEGADSLLWTSHLYAGREPLLYSLYLGCLLPPLACVGVRRLGRAWAALGGAGLLLGVGAGLPLVAPALARLPLVGGLRFPEKWLVLSAFVAAVGGALGFDALAAGEETAVRTIPPIIGGMALLAAAAVGGVVWGWPPWLATPPAEAAHPAWHAAALRLLGRHVGLCLAAGALAWWLGRRRSAVLSHLLVGLAVIELAVAGRPLLGFVPRGAVLEPPAFLHAVAAAGGTARVFHAPCSAGRAPVQARSLGCPPITAAWGVGTVLDPDLDRTQPRWVAAATSELLALGREEGGLLGAQLARRGVGGVVVGGGAVGLSGPTLLPLAGARPEVWCPHTVVTIDERHAWRSAVESLGPASRDAVVIERSTAGGARVQAGPCTLGRVTSRPGSIELEFEAEGDGAVIAVNRTWHPGWQARVDGRPVPVLRADLSLMAVAVPAGRHHLTLRYRDGGLAAGGAVSLLAVAALALLGLGEVRAASRSRRMATSAPAAPTR
ncbi:MAG TPA: YfhO family protein [Thermoanaerobaculaceae bacterium]|nr:YfhO family protein [Thermoanaerobaculaceae bacterium]HRS15902.1 YfhO family protein [Thermoanaerobaculaceae bacterium]